MGTRHENDKAIIEMLGASLARETESSTLDETTVSKFHDELASYDKETQLAVARAAFGQFQTDYSEGKTTRQLSIKTENVQRGGMPVGQNWLHSMSIEIEREQKPLNWTEHPVQSLSNAMDNMLSSPRKEIVLFEESQEEHDQQVSSQEKRMPRFLDFEAMINPSSAQAQ